MSLTASQQAFLKLLFNDGEEVCVSNDKYAYRSVPLKELFTKTRVSLCPNNSNYDSKVISLDEVTLIAINPVCGQLTDSNVMAYRSFLVELDEGLLDGQRKYVEEILKMPFSSCVFSGNKSLHYTITLTTELPESAWRHIGQWILNIVSGADQNTKNPSRRTRFPDNQRPDGRKLTQKAVYLGGRVDLDTLSIWLNKYSDKKPKQLCSNKKDFDVNPASVPHWLIEELEIGPLESRNNFWFSISCKMAERHFGFEYTLDLFDNYFTEERDFSRREWEGAIKSGYKHIEQKI